MLTISPGDRVTFLDFDANPVEGVVQIVADPQDIYGADPESGLSTFRIAVVRCDDMNRWCYLSQITEVNGLAVEP